MSPTRQVTDGLRALAVLPPLCLQRSLQADAFLLQAQLATLQQAAFVLQLTRVGLQLLQLLAALRLGFTEPRRRLGLGPQQRVGFFQLTRGENERRSVSGFVWLLITFLFVTERAEYCYIQTLHKKLYFVKTEIYTQLDRENVSLGG